MVVPVIFPQLKFHHIIVAYLIAPILPFCNSYGTDLTDRLVPRIQLRQARYFHLRCMGRFKPLWHHGRSGGLRSCGVVMGIVLTASDLMRDFKIGYLTLASPRSMVVSQVVGAAMGCVISPIVFWIFYTAFPGGSEGLEYPAPYICQGLPGIALLRVEGFSYLPKNYMNFCVIFFSSAIAINALKEVAGHKKWRMSRLLNKLSD
ncbi:putative metal-nicotianamine transporter YSL14 [Cocos nucifera]|uniref:Putative metal-nicotianamine transporter YSL14 n=1 Tax=Cocos nucifera TaxID=13894 RepID=A0A8K0IKL6_COCNU|nr:putative metal-nicotianamine transporter YSL14 [Cocos nucifera]